MGKNKVQVFATSKELVLRTETRFYPDTVYTLMTIVKVSTTYKSIHPEIEEKEMFRRGFMSMDEASKGLELATSIVAALKGDQLGK